MMPNTFIGSGTVMRFPKVRKGVNHIMTPLPYMLSIALILTPDTNLLIITLNQV